MQNVQIRWCTVTEVLPERDMQGLVRALKTAPKSETFFGLMGTIDLLSRSVFTTYIG